MKILLRILLALIVLLAIGVALLLTVAPREVHVERSTTIAATPEQIFPYVNNLKKSNEWSPWAEKDPDMEVTYEGPEAGVGAISKWKSEEMGEGSQTIVESEPNEKVATDLDFGSMGTAQAAILLEPAGGGGSTEVTWEFDTDYGYNPIGRFFGLLMDSMLGGDYEKGLANLKKLVEEGA